ncbi:hypothetical protein [Sphingomonas paucimobilis]|uniref:hypothetical protein n=1 Tax=Sphingomonas paucimobilis TaxID=13689 RepID=UPI000A57D4D5|nr:hypothetical protein [Sphingomonas paucimobilis]
MTGLASKLSRDFALYRSHMEVARDPDERDADRRRARERAAKARRRVERGIERIQAAGL